MAEDWRYVSRVAGWEQPSSKEVIYDWESIAEQLRSRPGEWAKIFDWDRTSVANAVRQGSVKALRPDDGFETRTRNNTRAPVRMCTLFMRYNPKSSNNTSRKKGK